MANETPAFRWGLIGPGKIARRFAGALPAVPGARLAAVFARDRARGEDFLARQPEAQGARVCTQLDELLAVPGLDAVYIATPHAQHGEFVRAALLAGKPVLCEKPLVPHLAQGQVLIDLARERGVFLMEALWTRFLPAYAVAGEWLRQGAIGELRGMQSSFCFPGGKYDPDSRLWNPALAGGALLDVGIYNLAVTRWVLEQAWGACPEPTAIQAQARLAPTGVDAAVTASISFPEGFVSQWRCGFDAASANACEILGSTGAIRFPGPFHEAIEVELLRRGEAPLRVAAPFVRNGFEGEIAEVQVAVRAGLVESPRMPHAESLALLRWMDAIRLQIGVRYPFE
jgi:predicted dehydrogenase